MSEKEYWHNQSKSFDASAAYYDRYRPGYPEQLITDILAKTGVDKDARILEIGAGNPV